MKDFFKTEIATNMGIFLLLCTAVLVSFLSIPLDYSSYEQDYPTSNTQKKDIDITRVGVPSTAPLDQSCRLLDNAQERDILVDTYDKVAWEDTSGKIWVRQSEVDELFPDINKKTAVNCRNLGDFGLEPMVLKKYKEGLWIHEVDVCLALARNCGISNPN